MKEATGELNMSVVVLLIISALVAFFCIVILPMITNGQEYYSNCSKAICDGKPDKDGMVTCTAEGIDHEFQCKFKG